jgi:hypothetical protein
MAYQQIVFISPQQIYSEEIRAAGTPCAPIIGREVALPFHSAQYASLLTPYHLHFHNSIVATIERQAVGQHPANCRQSTDKIRCLTVAIQGVPCALRRTQEI